MKAAADKTMKEILISPDGKKELVLVMAIYGANAAEKSNVIHVLLLMRKTTEAIGLMDNGLILLLWMKFTVPVREDIYTYITGEKGGIRHESSDRR